MPPQLLVINPNTSASVSTLLNELALREASGRCQVRVQTARLGASYISDEVSFAIAGHALLDAYAFDAAQPGQQSPDAVLIGCFGDPGLLALRQLSDVPVLGLAQASMQAAHQAAYQAAQETEGDSGRYAVITGGQAWVPMLYRLAAQLRLDDKLASVRAVDKTGAQLAAHPEDAVRELADLCEQLLTTDGPVQTVLLGGAALGGLAQPVQAALLARGIRGVRLMDSVAVSLQMAIEQAEAHAAQRAAGIAAQSNSRLGSGQGLRSPTASLNLSAELQALLGSTRAG
jgi:allantoin racemase